MKKLSKNQKGFTAVETVLVIAILVLIGVVGWLVYKNHHKTTTSTTYSSTAKTSTSSSTTKTTTPTTTTKPPANPYAGWKTYTTSDSTSFKYPTNWTLTTSSQYVLLNSPVDSSNNLTYQLSYGPTYNRSQVLKDTTVSSTPLNISLSKPLYMLTMDFNNSNGKDIDGLYVSDTNSAKGSSINPTFIGFMPKNSTKTMAFEAILQPLHYQNNGGETLATYQNNPYYETVVKIFKSLE